VSLHLESLKVLTRSGFPQDLADVHFELAVTRTCLSSLTNVDQRDEIARELCDRPRLLHPVVVPFPVDGNPIAANRHVGKLSRLNRCGALRYSRHLRSALPAPQDAPDMSTSILVNVFGDRPLGGLTARADGRPTKVSIRSGPRGSWSRPG
jgi:hypothetical protein